MYYSSVLFWLTAAPDPLSLPESLPPLVLPLSEPVLLPPLVLPLPEPVLLPPLVLPLPPVLLSPPALPLSPEPDGLDGVALPLLPPDVPPVEPLPVLLSEPLLPGFELLPLPELLLPELLPELLLPELLPELLGFELPEDGFLSEELDVPVPAS